MLDTLSRLMTVPEVAKYLRVSNARVYELLREKILPGVKLGRQVRINPTDLQQFVNGGGMALANGWRRSA